MPIHHPQLEPTVNRSRRIPGGPASLPRTPHQIDQPPADPENPYRMTHTGLYTDTLQDESGAQRPYTFYIPTTMKTSGNMALVFVPGGESPEAFFHAASWKESLERHCMTAYFLGAPQGWQMDNPGLEIDAATRVLGEMRSMEYFPSNAPAVYCLGFGDGAAVAAVFAVLHVSVLAAWAAWGDTGLDDTLLESLGTAPSDCDPHLTRGEVPLPTFLIGAPSNTARFFRRACRTRDEYLFNGFARVYRQKPIPGESYLNDTACSEVWLCEDREAEVLGQDVMIEKMVAFVTDYRRCGGEGNSHIRHTERAEADLGMKRTEIVVDGLKRYWYTFEPSAYKLGLKEKYPLVIAIHGFSCSAEFFAENSGWHRVAQERGFLVVYPNAYPHTGKKSNTLSNVGSIAATPRWNSSIPPEQDGPDEIAFFQRLLERVEADYPIDRERIYVTGHSNGSMMTQALMRFWPGPFAGFAPVGFMEGFRMPSVAPENGVIRNPWYVMGEYDIDTSSLEGDNGNTRTLRMICQCDGLDYDHPRRYECGIYEHTLFRNAEGTTLARYTAVKNWPHTYTPELAFMIYDQWFSHFIRRADGTLIDLA